MRIFLVISLLIFTLTACEKSRPGKDLIPPEIFVPVLVDLHLVYSIQSSQEFRTISREVDSIDTYNYVFEKYNIDRVLFDSTVSWYSRHPERFTEIYDEVVMQLSQMADSLDSESEE